MGKSISKQISKILANKKTIILNNPLESNSLKKVTVIIPAFNAIDTINTSINSVINQSFPFKEIELIIIDDCSTDGTKDILLEYAERYSNICAVFFNKNTGTPGMPRNVGIELTTSDKLLFLDADDWLHKDGIKHLYNKMESTNADSVLGKTVKVTESGESVHAEFISYKERTHLPPYKIPYLFYHMGPPSKLIKSKIIKENNIKFPEMKFAEDKYFFLMALDKCRFVSTITNPVCYINRKSKNKSLTRTTQMIEKRTSDLEVIKEIIKQKLRRENEKQIMKRLLEYDLIRGCDSNLFVQSKNKQAFIKLISKALSITKDLPYNVIESFDIPLYKFAAELVVNERYNDFIQLFKWEKQEMNKHIVINDNLPFYYLPFLKKNEMYIPIPLYAMAKDTHVLNNSFVQTFEIYGDMIDTAKHIVIRDRKRIDNELKIPFKIENNIGEFKIDLKELAQVNNSLFNIFIQYDGHKLINIKRIQKSNATYQERSFSLYTTRQNNIAFSLKPIRK